MQVLLAVYSVVLLISFAVAPSMGAGWAWDADNGLGFAAFAGMLYLTIPSNSRRYVRAHEKVGYAVLGVAAAHALCRGCHAEKAAQGAEGGLPRQCIECHLSDEVP